MTVGPVITMKVTGEKQARRRLQDLAANSKDLRPAFGRIVTLFHKHEREIFKSRGARKWPPLDKKTVQFKRRRGYPRQAMRRSDGIYQSLTNSMAAGAVVNIESQQVTVGTKVEYAVRAQHSGGGRRLIIVRPKDRRAYGDAILDHVGRGVA